jgi:hypothetical protein
MKRFSAALLALFTCLATAQPAPPGQPLRLRATIESVDAASMTVRERGGEVVRLALDDKLTVSEVLPIELSALKAGAYVGTAAMPRPDGTLEAIEVHVFPESARGTGEGHRPWDMQPGSTMTNATVADLAAAPQGRRLTLTYKDGTKTLIVPEGVPVVTFKPADRSLLVPGAKVVVTAELRDGQPTALRVLAGRDGFAPPL